MVCAQMLWLRLWGGRAGAQAFAQAQDMVRRGGLLQVVGLYEDEPLPLDSSKIQGKRLIGGYLDSTRRPQGSDMAIQLLMEDKIQTEAMVDASFLILRMPQTPLILFVHAP